MNIKTAVFFPKSRLNPEHFETTKVEFRGKFYVWNYPQPGIKTTSFPGPHQASRSSWQHFISEESIVMSCYTAFMTSDEFLLFIKTPIFIFLSQLHLFHFLFSFFLIAVMFLPIVDSRTKDQTSWKSAQYVYCHCLKNP